MNIVPKILLVSDAALNVNGGGISQTLANIFLDVPKDRLMILSSKGDYSLVKQDRHFVGNTIVFNSNVVPNLTNRIGLYVNKYIQKISFFIFLKSSIPSLSTIRNFAPDIIIVCAQGKEGVVIGEKVINVLKKPACVYFMDDWFADQEEKWWGGSLKKSLGNLLQNSKGWIMISEYLADTIANRTSIHSKPLLVLHNPVDPWHNPQDLIDEPKDLDIAYAGALWPMHLDAFLLIAKALKNLNEQGHEGKLTLYCRNNFWDNNQKYFVGLPVFFGGFLPYSEVNSALSKHPFALVCSSFDKDNKFLTASSVQTKITDYMNAERLIISIGPDYGACNLFIEKHQIGCSISSPDVNVISAQLLKILQEKEVNKEKILKAKSLILNHYTKKEVVRKLYDFINHLI